MDEPSSLLDLTAGLSAGKQERADAARNRTRVLNAAARLFAEHGPGGVSMQDIARAAGVGKGTLYRRYPDIASIAVALLDDHERTLQEKLLRGEPPLGPGAPPGERLAAFYEAMAELLDQHTHLVLGTETGRSRFATGAYGFWRTHVAALLREAGTEDREAMVDLLLAPLAPEVFQFQRDQLGLDVRQIARALTALARSVVPNA
ncbi:TetR family transcriptional regulator [Streptomyces sp. Act143]|uniref:TetR/AcrR family transcriptional regulator n=1 Tax=Streptomyces sp. Act143 TaxID=2200760 RepID=UPI000D67EEAA|nr:TetR/AcrR family transcriptional regulator [Streptomyces sp. Act143]PWI12940.1 TetR family transcriptional regulator [Streptomyces sp. Act143]